MKPSNQDCTFDTASLPLLDLMSGPVTVDIGYLSGEAHRQAFADIFGKVISDNAGLIAGSQLTRADPARAVREGPNLPLTAQDVVARCAHLTLTLYDSRSERAVLHFASPGKSLAIGVRFDNPEFWLE